MPVDFLPAVIAGLITGIVMAMSQQERGFRQQQTDRPDDGQDNLFAPMGGTGSATGEFGQRSKATSLYTRHLELHPNRKRVLNAAVLAGLVALVRRIGR